MNVSRMRRAVPIALAVLALAACTSHATRTPAPTPAYATPSPSASASAFGLGYFGYGQPLGAPIPDLVKDRFTHVTKLSSKKSKIVGPAYGVTFTETTTATVISGVQQIAIGLARDDDPTPSPMQAPAGFEFVVVQIGPPPDYTSTGKPSDVTWAVHAGPQSVPTPDRFAGPDGGFAWDGSFVVTVPRGADAVLSATEDGKTQSISLRTGKVATASGASSASLRSGDTTFFTVLQLSGSGIDIAAVAGLPHNAYPILFTVHASLALNADGHPAAAAGRAWLVLQAYTINDATDTQVDTEFSVDLPLRSSLKIRAGGKPIEVPDDSADAGVYIGGAPVTWVVDVPRTLTSLQVFYTFTGSVEQWTAPVIPGGSATSKKISSRVASGRSKSVTLRLEANG